MRKSDLTEPIGIRVTTDLKTALQKAADDDRRPLAAMIKIILNDYLEQKNRLPQRKAAK